MKKLFIISIFLCIIFFPKNIFALEYQVNETTYQVDSEETFRDYIYYTYINGTNYGQFFIARTNNKQIYYVIIPKNSTDKIITDYDYLSRYRVVSDFTPSYVSFYILVFNNFQDTSNWSYYTLQTNNQNYNNWLPYQNASTRVYYPVYYRAKNSALDSFTEMSANYTFEDITSRYVVEEPEEEEVSNMFECSIELIKQFITYIPVLLTLYVVFDIVGDILPLRRK